MVELIQRIFSQFQTQHRPLVFIRPKAIQEPDIYIGDFDLLIHPKDTFSFFSTVQQCCAAMRYSFSLKRHRLNKMELTLFSHDSNRSVLMDIWTELDIKSPTIPKGSAILTQTLIDKGYIHFNENNESALSPNIAALFYLSHLYSKKKSLESSEVQKRLHYFLSLTGVDEKVKEWLANPSHKSMQLANDDLKSLGLVYSNRQHRISKNWFRLKQDVRKKRKFIAIVGPDGVGKTTVIDSLTHSMGGQYYRFKKMFRKGLLYHVLYRTTKKKLDKKSGIKLAKNQFDDEQHKKLFWIALLGGYLRGLAFNIGKFKFIDRYYPDLLIQGTRFLDKNVTRDQKAKEKIVLCPTPLAYIQLDAPAEVIHSRKQELSVIAINHLRSDYFEIGYMLNSPLFIYINNSHSIEATQKLIREIKL